MLALLLWLLLNSCLVCVVLGSSITHISRILVSFAPFRLLLDEDALRTAYWYSEDFASKSDINKQDTQTLMNAAALPSFLNTLTEGATVSIGDSVPIVPTYFELVEVNPIRARLSFQHTPFQPIGQRKVNGMIIACCFSLQIQSSPYSFVGCVC